MQDLLLAQPEKHTVALIERHWLKAFVILPQSLLVISQRLGILLKRIFTESSDALEDTTFVFKAQHRNVLCLVTFHLFVIAISFIVVALFITHFGLCKNHHITVPFRETQE